MIELLPTSLKSWEEIMVMREEGPFSGMCYFGGSVPPDIELLLGKAALHFSDTESSLSFLNEALNQRPDLLAVYFSMYKFFFYKNRLVEAEDIARQALREAARQGGFYDDPSRLSTIVQKEQFSDPFSPHYFYLFSLKALSFILLRQKKLEKARNLLAILEEVDPSDRTGASVIRDYANGATKVSGVSFV